MTDSLIQPDRDLLAASCREHGQLESLLCVSARSFGDGHVHAHVSHLDPGLRRLIPGPDTCIVANAPSRAALLEWVAWLATDTRLAEAAEPPLPW